MRIITSIFLITLLVIGCSVQHEDETSQTFQPEKKTPLVSKVLSINGSWENVGTDITGVMSASASSGNGTFELDLSDLNKQCSGSYYRIDGEFSSAIKPYGKWSLVCDDGIRASGKYYSVAPWRETLEGTDSQGRKVSFIYK